MIKFEIYQDRSWQYRWRLKARNGEIVAVSEGYTTKQGAVRSVALIKRLAPLAVTTYLS